MKKGTEQEHKYWADLMYVQLCSSENGGKTQQFEEAALPRSLSWSPIQRYPTL